MQSRVLNNPHISKGHAGTVDSMALLAQPGRAMVWVDANVCYISPESAQNGVLTSRTPLACPTLLPDRWESPPTPTQEHYSGSIVSRSTFEDAIPQQEYPLLPFAPQYTQNLSTSGHIIDAPYLFSPCTTVLSPEILRGDLLQLVGSSIYVEDLHHIQNYGAQPYSMRAPTLNSPIGYHTCGTSVTPSFHIQLYHHGRIPETKQHQSLEMFEFGHVDADAHGVCFGIPYEALIVINPSLCIGSTTSRRNDETNAPPFAQVWQQEQAQPSEWKLSPHLLPTIQTSATDELLMARVNHRPTPAHSILATAFTENAYHPNPALRALLDKILHANFLTDDAREPSIGEDYSICALAQIVHLPGCPSLGVRNLHSSLFLVFVSTLESRCLFCGSCKSSLARALGCVRAHLGHRPFGCTGCNSCNILSGYARFSTPSLLKDHINGQQKKMKCVRCQTELRRGGMRRHWTSMHKGERFPYHIYPKYRRDNDKAGSTIFTPRYTPR